MTEDLQRRIQRFDQLASRVDCERPSPLIIKARITPELFRGLRYATAVYMSRCLGGKSVFARDSIILDCFHDEWTGLKNRSHNGTLVPKRELVLEYNMVFRFFADVIKSFNLADLIAGFTILTVRHKEEWSHQKNSTGGYATVNPHSDAWIGESPLGINVITPIFGDIKNNNVSFFAPPDNFCDDWLRPLERFKQGQEIFQQYDQTPVAESSQWGFVYFSDFSVIHQTNVQENAGQRVSIDNFAFHNVGQGELSHPDRPRLILDQFCRIGREELITFWPSIDDPITNENSNFHKTWSILNLNGGTLDE